MRYLFFILILLYLCSCDYTGPGFEPIGSDQTKYNVVQPSPEACNQIGLTGIVHIQQPGYILETAGITAYIINNDADIQVTNANIDVGGYCTVVIVNSQITAVL